MRRREFITLLSGVAVGWPLEARAQQQERVRRIGVLQGVSKDDLEWQRRFAAFNRSLQQQGWKEGQNITFELRFADAKPERLPELAAELVRANVEVIATSAAQPIEAARKATRTIPIVMATVGDAVGAGYVASLAHPGGNVTGLTLVATDQSAKRLQLIKEISPSVARVAVIWNAGASGHRLQMKEMEITAPTFGISLQSLPIRSADELTDRLRSAIASNAQAVVTMDDPLVQSQRARIVEFTMQRRLPLMSEFKVGTEAGGLISYGPNQIEMWRRAAAYVDKILRGAKPADLPVEQPTKFELVINRKTANALGLDIPAALLATADEVIE